MRQRAFTLIEIIIALGIIAVLVAIALPNFLTTYNRAAAKDAWHNLMAIKSSQLTYLIAHGAYYSTNPGVSDDVQGINQNLGLNITPSAGTSYGCCAQDSTGQYICHALRSGLGGFDMSVRLTMPLNPGNVPVYGPQNNPSCIGGSATDPCPGNGPSFHSLNCQSIPGTGTGTSTGTATGTATGTSTGTSTGTATGTSTGTATGTSTGTATGTSTGTATGGGVCNPSCGGTQCCLNGACVQGNSDDHCGFGGTCQDCQKAATGQACQIDFSGIRMECRCPAGQSINPATGRCESDTPNPDDCQTYCSTGCCDAAGTCHPGIEQDSCGTGGTICQSCHGSQICSAGACITPGTGTGSGTGTGTGSVPHCGPDNCGGCCVGQVCIPYSLSSRLPATCGTGGENCRACGPNQDCVLGQCACLGGQTLCPDGCRSLLTDNQNCGACGHVCPTGQTCVNGSCQGPITCTAHSDCGSGSCCGLHSSGPPYGCTVSNNLDEYCGPNCEDCRLRPTTPYCSGQIGTGIPQCSPPVCSGRPGGPGTGDTWQQNPCGQA